MNLIIKIGPLANTNVNQQDPYGPMKFDAAWIITPGSLHANGEVYETRKIAEPVTDLVLPRAISDEIRRLEVQCKDVYLIRVPAIGLGSTHLEIGERNAPIMVQNGVAPGKGTPSKQQK